MHSLPLRYHVVDAGVGRGVGDRLEGRSGSVGVGGRRHLPGEVHLRLVDTRLLAALLHHRVFGVVGVAGGDAHQRVAGRRQRLLAALLGHLLDVVVVGQRHHLGGREGTLLLKILSLKYRILKNQLSFVICFKAAE